MGECLSAGYKVLILDGVGGVGAYGTRVTSILAANGDSPMTCRDWQPSLVASLRGFL